ncbi:hypothetical protein A2U01_0062964, partial [Trifolium medium]|nr:hypothetical protein [Trifolium medium]
MVEKQPRGLQPMPPSFRAGASANWDT